MSLVEQLAGLQRRQPRPAKPAKGLDPESDAGAAEAALAELGGEPRLAALLGGRLGRETDDEALRAVQLLAALLPAAGAVAVLSFLLRRHGANAALTDAFALALLPFHQTPLFARSLDALKPALAASPRWAFLAGAGSPAGVGRAVLVQQMSRDSGWLAGHVLEAVRAATAERRLPPALLHLAAALVSDLLCALPATTLQAVYVPILLPHLVSCLKAAAHLELQQTSVMLFVLLRARVPLAEPLLAAYTAELLRSMASTPPAHEAALLALLLLDQPLPAALALPFLAHYPRLGAALERLARKHDAGPLLRRIIAAALDVALEPAAAPADRRRAADVLQAVVARPALCSAGLAEALVAGLYAGSGAEDEDRPAGPLVAELAAALLPLLPAARLQPAFERLARLHAASARGRLVRFLQAAGAASPAAGRLQLFVSLNHADAAVRQLAVAQLDQALRLSASLDPPARADLEAFAAEWLGRALADDDDRVVCAAMRAAAAAAHLVPLGAVERLLAGELVAAMVRSESENERGEAFFATLLEEFLPAWPALSPRLALDALFPLLLISAAKRRQALRARAYLAGCHPLLHALRATPLAPATTTTPTASAAPDGAPRKRKAQEDAPSGAEAAVDTNAALVAALAASVSGTESAGWLAGRAEPLALLVLGCAGLAPTELHHLIPPLRRLLPRAARGTVSLLEPAPAPGPGAAPPPLALLRALYEDGGPRPGRDVAASLVHWAASAQLARLPAPRGADERALVAAFGLDLLQLAAALPPPKRRRAAGPAAPALGLASALLRALLPALARALGLAPLVSLLVRLPGPAPHPAAPVVALDLLRALLSAGVPLPAPALAELPLALLLALTAPPAPVRRAALRLASALAGPPAPAGLPAALGQLAAAALAASAEVLADAAFVRLQLASLCRAAADARALLVHLVEQAVILCAPATATDPGSSARAQAAAVLALGLAGARPELAPLLGPLARAPPPALQAALHALSALAAAPGRPAGALEAVLADLVRACLAGPAAQEAAALAALAPEALSALGPAVQGELFGRLLALHAAPATGPDARAALRRLLAAARLDGPAWARHLTATASASPPQLLELDALLELLLARCTAGPEAAPTGLAALVGPLLAALEALGKAVPAAAAVPPQTSYTALLLLRCLVAATRALVAAGADADPALAAAYRLPVLLAALDGPGSGADGPARELIELVATALAARPPLAAAFAGAELQLVARLHSAPLLRRLCQRVVPPVAASAQAAPRLAALLAQLLARLPDAAERALVLPAALDAVPAAYLAAVFLALLTRAAADEAERDDLLALCVSLAASRPAPAMADALLQLLSDVLPPAAPAAAPGRKRGHAPPSAAADRAPLRLRLLTFVAALLSSPAYRTAAGRAAEQQQEEGAARLQQAYEAIVVQLMLHLQRLDDDGAAPARARAEEEQAAAAALEAANELQSMGGIVRTVRRVLAEHHGQAARRRALDLLNQRCAGRASDLPEALTLLPHLSPVLRSTAEPAANKQMALQCLEILARTLAAANPAPFDENAPAVLDAVRSQHTNVAAAAALCLGSYAAALGVGLLPHLPQAVPALLDALDRALRAEATGSSSGSATARLALLSAVHVLVSHLHAFLSPYLTVLLGQLARPELALFASSHPALRQRLDDLQAELARRLAPRLLLPALFSAYRSASSRPARVQLLAQLGRVLQRMSKDEVAGQHKLALKFFLTCLDDAEMAPEAIAALLELVMKLSEQLFRPLFLQLLEWADLLPAADAPSSSPRVALLYKIAAAFMGKLKSIFVPYTGYLLDDLLARLASPHGAAIRPAVPLLSDVLSLLREAFLYDAEGFFDKEKFDKIVPVLVDQLDRASDQHLVPVVGSHLIPCIGQLGLCMNSDALWKPLNYQILLKTRHQSPPIRLHALRALAELYAKLGEEYLILVPETIPFLSELLEDPVPEVESECQHLIRGIDTLMGGAGSIKEFFSR